MNLMSERTEELGTLEMEQEWRRAPSPREHTLDDITSFAEQYSLEHKLSVLQAAAARIQRGEDALSRRTPRSKWKQPLDLYCCIVATALGATGQGWSQTGINGANLYYPKRFNIGPLTTGFINCAIYLSNGLLGSWLVAPLNRQLGRRGAVFVGALITLIFNILSSSAGGWQSLLFDRLVLGVGLGIISSTLNVFAAECSPAAIRGGLGVAWQMFCAFGIFLGFLTNMYADNNPEAFGPLRWRIMLLAGAFPSIPLLFIIFYCPESPAWCIKETQNYGRAFQELCRLRSTEREAAQELLLSYFQRNEMPVEDTKRRSFLHLLSGLFTVPRVRRATVAAYTTQLAQQLCGINIVAFYSSTIFVEAHFIPYLAELASTIFGLFNWLGAFPAIWTMDSLGRRSLLLLTLPFMAVTMAIAGMSFSITDPKLRFYLTAGMIYLFCLLYSPGVGPVPAAYTAEVFPSSHRELGASSAIAFTNLMAAALSLTFPWLLATLGTQGSFLLFAALNIVAWILVFLLVPETKRKSLEELDEVFSISTRTFMRHQIKEYAPWWTKRYLLMQRNATLKNDILDSTRYEAVGDHDFD